MRKFLLSIFAVLFAFAGVQAQSYVKVTSAPSDWSGDYLIVYETGNVAFNGGLTALDAVSNTVAVTISNGEIAATDAINKAKFTIAKSGNSYTIKSASGYYVGQSSNANGLKSSKTTTYNNALSINADGSVNFVSSGAYLRYNATSGQYRFRYYKSSSYTGQKAIALYKYTEAAGGEEEVKQVVAPVIEPNGGQVTAETEITITCATEGAQIYYTTDGVTPTTESTLYNGAFKLTAAATVKAIAVADGLETSDIVTAQFTFPVVCENIAAFIANEDEENYATISGEVVVVAQSGKYLFVQDNSAKIIVYGEIGKEYKAGDRLTGIKGKYSPYNGLVEMVPDTESFGEATAGDAIEPVAITLVELATTDLLTYVTISDVNVPAGSGKSYTVKDASGTATMYNTLGIKVPAGVGTITGFVSVFNTTRQLMPLEIVMVSAAPAAPTLTAESEFEEKMTVEITNVAEGATAYYSLNNDTDWEEGTSVEITETTTVYAKVVKDGVSSEVVSAKYTKNDPVTPPAEGEATVEVNAKDYFGDATINISKIVVAPVTLTFAKNNGSTAPAYNKAGDCRIYAKGSITAACSAGNLTRIVFEVSEQGKKRLTDLTPSTGTITIADDRSTITWEGNASEVVLTVGEKAVYGTDGEDKAGQICFTSFAATYTSGNVETPYYTLTVGEAGYATLFLDFAATIPAEVKAYTVTEVNNGYVTLTQVEGVIPANTGIIVKADEDDYNFVASTGAAADVTGNKLLGTTKDTVIESAAYVLGIKDGIVGLYTATTNGYAEGTFLNNANKAYLPKSAGMNAASYSFRFGEGTTGIENVEAAEAVKVIFDLTGRRVEAITAPGIYIVNGKKVLVK